MHRGTHQIGGIAVEICTDKTRILIDMGDELSLDADFVSEPLHIPGVTDRNGTCDAVLFTHYHGDHIGQMDRICSEIPLYAGALAKDVMLMSAERGFRKDTAHCDRIRTIQTYKEGTPFVIGNIQITPYSIDHSAIDSYMFLIEADGKRVLYTGDFRLHGFRGKGIPKILDKLIHKVDVLLIEGTTLSRADLEPMAEAELQQKVREYMDQYKYVFVMCASTNLERICAMSKAVPRGKYFICDQYQKDLLSLVEQQWGHYSPLYRDIKKTTYGENILPRLQERGFLMMVRDNRNFRRIIPKFDRDQSIILYSMWDGYRTKEGSTIPTFLDLVGRWESLHTSGHASYRDIKMVIEMVNPDLIIPIHTEVSNGLQALCSGRNVLMPEDGEQIIL